MPEELVHLGNELPYQNKKLKETARSMRTKATPEEDKLWYGYLRKADFTVNRQKVLGNFVVDFYCSKARLVIELDGSQHYAVDGLQKDRERTAYLEGMGLKVIRFTNQQVRQDFQGVCKTIETIVRARLNGER